VGQGGRARQGRWPDGVGPEPGRGGGQSGRQSGQGGGVGAEPGRRPDGEAAGPGGREVAGPGDVERGGHRARHRRRRVGRT
jgi:hypothetical protein